MDGAGRPRVGWASSDRLPPSCITQLAGRARLSTVKWPESDLPLAPTFQKLRDFMVPQRGPSSTPLW